MRFPGIIPAVTTPFAASGAIDTAALQANVRALLDAGVHGLVATGTMGEAGSLSTRERRDVIAAIAEAVDGRVPVIAGVSAGTAAQAGAARRRCVRRRRGRAHVPAAAGLPRRRGARSRPSTRAVAEATGLPLMAYNNPEASGVDMPADAHRADRRRVERLVAVKECSGDVRRIPRSCCTRPDLEVLVGGDDWALEGFAAGATGWVSGVADVAPAPVRRALRALPRRRARRRARGLPPLAAARALRHDPQARAVLQGGAWTPSASPAARRARRACR